MNLPSTQQRIAVERKGCRNSIPCSQVNRTCCGALAMQARRRACIGGDGEQPEAKQKHSPLSLAAASAHYGRGECMLHKASPAVRHSSALLARARKAHPGGRLQHRVLHTRSCRARRSMPSVAQALMVSGAAPEQPQWPLQGAQRMSRRPKRPGRWATSHAHTPEAGAAVSPLAASTPNKVREAAHTEERWWQLLANHTADRAPQSLHVEL